MKVMFDKKHYYKLIHGTWIIGIIDSYGHVESKLYYNFEDAETHETLYPNQLTGKWRWNWDKSINNLTMVQRLTREEHYKIESHLEKRYGIKFWENGHHDIQYIMKKAREEKPMKVKKVIKMIDERIEKAKFVNTAYSNGAFNELIELKQQIQEDNK